MAEDITIGEFGRGAHGRVVSIGNLDIYFSYRTPVAFRDDGKLVVSENCWSTTTGNHLNAIDGGGEAKKRRTPCDEFKTKFKALLKEHGLV